MVGGLSLSSGVAQLHVSTIRRARAAELPLGWSEKQVVDARVTQLGEFVGAVEKSLCGFAPSSGKGESLSIKDAVNIRRLLTLLRSRYGSQPDALRQLALLFSLLPPEAQPTDAIEQLAAEQENRDGSEVLVIDGGSFVLSDVFLSTGMPAPALPLPAAPLANQASKAAVAGVPLIRATGRVIEMVVTNGGGGYDDEHPPLVSITAPLSAATPSDARSSDRSVSKSEPWRTGRRAAEAKAIVINGKVVALELTDVGAGYNRGYGVSVVIATPPLVKPGQRRGSAGLLGLPATGKVLLEYEIGSVSLARRGGGYGSSQDLEVRFFSLKTSASSASSGGRRAATSSGKRQEGAKPNNNFKTPSALEMAEAPWSQEAMAAKYGDRATARSTGQMLVLRPPSATLVLGKQRPPAAAAKQKPFPDSSTAAASSNVLPLARPPQLPSSPRDSGVIDGLLALLPPEEGAPIFDPGFPPSKKYPVGLPTRHRFPSSLYETIADAYVLKAPLGKRKQQKGGTLSKDVSALPTSITGGVTQDVPLRPSLVARLTIAGGLCSAITRAVTSPIDLRKTRAQSEKPATPATEALLSAQGPLNSTDDIAPQPSTELFDPSLFLGMDASMAAGFASGAASFGTYEYLRRTIPQLAASFLGPAAPADLFTPILFAACLLQSVAASICSSPFETARVKIMAGAAGAVDAPKTLVAALDDVMRTPLITPLPKEFFVHCSIGTAEDAHGGERGSMGTWGAGQLDFGRLWDGLPTLMGRELPFGVTKLLVYASTQDALLSVFPAARERPLFALVVSLIAGLVAGSLAGLASHPADTVVTRLATGGFGRDWRAALDDVLSGAESDEAADKAKVLYAGVRQRCLALAIIVTAQFVLFDGLRTLLAVSKEDLSLILDVFEDRLDFYSAWDEAEGRWLDAVDNLDLDLFL